MINYVINDMSFPGEIKYKNTEPERKLTKKELQVLTKLLNGIRNGVFYETIMQINYTDNDAVTLFELTDKLNELAK